MCILTQWLNQTKYRLPYDRKRIEANTMIYYFPEAKFSAKHLGLDLMKKIQGEYTASEIAEWIYPIYTTFWKELNKKQDQILNTLTYMEMGPEFELPREELIEIAEELINSDQNTDQ